MFFGGGSADAWGNGGNRGRETPQGPSLKDMLADRDGHRGRHSDSRFQRKESFHSNAESFRSAKLGLGSGSGPDPRDVEAALSRSRGRSEHGDHGRTNAAGRRGRHGKYHEDIEEHAHGSELHSMYDKFCGCFDHEHPRSRSAPVESGRRNLRMFSEGESHNDIAEARQHAVDKGRSLRLILIGFVLVFLALCVGAVALLWVFGFIQDVSHEFVLLFYITLLFTLLLALLYFYLRMEIRATEASLLARMDEVEDLIGQRGSRRHDRKQSTWHDYAPRRADHDSPDDPYGTRNYSSGALSKANDFAKRGTSGALGMFNAAADAFSHGAHGHADDAMSYAGRGALGAWDAADGAQHWANDNLSAFGDYSEKQRRAAEKEAKRQARKGLGQMLSAF